MFRTCCKSIKDCLIQYEKDANINNAFLEHIQYLNDEKNSI